MSEPATDNQKLRKKGIARWMVLGVLMGFYPGFLVSAFGFSRMTAALVSLVVVLLIGYPLLFRGYPNPWTRDKRPYTLRSYSTVAAGGIALAIALNLLFNVIFPNN